MSSMEEKLRMLSMNMGIRRHEDDQLPQQALPPGRRCIQRVHPAPALEISAGLCSCARDERAVSLAGKTPVAGFDVGRSLFLDTETTGLSGGVGTLAFLIGVGYLRGGDFVVEQFFMEDYDAEPDMLRRLCDLFAGFDYIVTYNGKSFDIPIVNNRSVLNRIRQPLERLVHIDLLHAARRMYKERLGSCSLQVVEKEVLGFARQGDIPGSVVPMIFFDFLATGNMEQMDKVMAHNLRDVQSLYAVLCRLCHDILHPESLQWPQDRYSLGRIFESAGDVQAALAQYELAGEQYAGALRSRAMLLKRVRRMDESAECWARLMSSGLCGVEPYEELAKYYEHTRREPARALEVVDACMDRLRVMGLPQALDSIAKRRIRLQNRLSKNTES